MNVTRSAGLHPRRGRWSCGPHEVGTRSVVVALSACLSLTACAAAPEPPPDRVSRSFAPSPTLSQGSPVPLRSPRGRVVFSTLSLGGEHPTVDVHVLTLPALRVTNLTAGGTGGFDPTWSPDGSRIAYRVEPAGSEGEGSDIWVMRADGSHKRNLTRDGNGNWSPAWSPDGRSIAFASGGTDGIQHIFVMNEDGTGRQQITEGEGEYPSWSPDGRRIAFMSQEPDAAGDNPNYNVYVVDIDGSNLTRLTDAPGSDGIPDWSPDGTAIAFTSGRDDCGVSERADCETSGDIGPYHGVYVMRADGTAETRLTEGPGYYPTWSPDGRHILYSAGGLFVMRADGSGSMKVPLPDLGEVDFTDWIA